MAGLFARDLEDGTVCKYSSSEDNIINVKKIYKQFIS